jgi:hypothetical protein
VLDELNHLQVEYVPFRENIETGGPLGRAIVVVVNGARLIVELVRAGMRHAKLEGQHIGHRPLELDNAAI